MLTSLPLLVCSGAGLTGGVYFAYSSFIMKALAGLPAADGIVAAFFPWGTTRSLLLLTAGLAYLIGSFGVTVAFNVPRNQRLAGMAEGVEARAYWPLYVREWLGWNHVRTAASTVSSVGAALALAC